MVTLSNRTGASTSKKSGLGQAIRPSRRDRASLVPQELGCTGGRGAQVGHEHPHLSEWPCDHPRHSPQVAANGLTSHLQNDHGGVQHTQRLDGGDVEGDDVACVDACSREKAGGDGNAQDNTGTPRHHILPRGLEVATVASLPRTPVRPIENCPCAPTSHSHSHMLSPQRPLSTPPHPQARPISSYNSGQRRLKWRPPAPHGLHKTAS